MLFMLCTNEEISKNYYERDVFWMREALRMAALAALREEVPVGAVAIVNDKIVGVGFNQPITSCDPSAHAEIIALRAAAKTLGNYRLPDVELFVTLEPCLMCVGAMVHARIKRLVYGAVDPKTGAVQSVFKLLDADATHNHRIPYVGGVLQEECGAILKKFFQSRR
jgi:tRNA(adenine34) deaminase